ncbi:hypothetical protein AAFF_G00330070 [Aldrovandia affinis]|uniref:Uncharacterized protein n=1 Tax=Aldrovandia affinis TaxID=143900 RepID=A0AAD7WPX1_9TELE|nr:hypothetical protein AAFF_G00330070 [Aldrovandia affinis]
MGRGEGHVRKKSVRLSALAHVWKRACQAALPALTPPPRPAKPPPLQRAILSLVIESRSAASHHGRSRNNQQACGEGDSQFRARLPSIKTMLPQNRGIMDGVT